MLERGGLEEITLHMPKRRPREEEKNEESKENINVYIYTSHPSEI
jgi:hypothetical protein